jgi:hypothetical protein
MKLYLALLIAISAFFTETSALFAYEIPNFTSCVNPQGEIKASYETGTHGIAGKPGLFEGKDTVYTVSQNALTQCFCAVDGQGIQTNFWKIPTLRESEINVLTSQGWIYIPNGALWGLSNDPYLAKNSDFSCKSSGGNGGSNNVSGGSSDSNSSGSSSNSSGSVLSAASGGVGQVLGLASTGNSIFLLGTALTSGLSLILGIILKNRSKKFSK